jgi:hypothetical protein
MLKVQHGLRRRWIGESLAVQFHHPLSKMRLDLFQLGERDFVREARSEATIEVVKSALSCFIGQFVVSSIFCIEPGGDRLIVIELASGSRPSVGAALL